MERALYFIRHNSIQKKHITFYDKSFQITISVIVPVYKVERYIRQFIESIIHQTYLDIEILLIDDESPDRCGEICDEYARIDKRIRVFHTDNKGLSVARNLGLHEAKGEYIGFVDPDDWIEPDIYEILLQRLNETGADICAYELWRETHYGCQCGENVQTSFCNREEAIKTAVARTFETCPTRPPSKVLFIYLLPDQSVDCAFQ